MSFTFFFSVKEAINKNVLKFMQQQTQRKLDNMHPHQGDNEEGVGGVKIKSEEKSEEEDFWGRRDLLFGLGLMAIRWTLTHFYILFFCKFQAYMGRVALLSFFVNESQKKDGF